MRSGKCSKCKTVLTTSNSRKTVIKIGSGYCRICQNSYNHDNDSGWLFTIKGRHQRLKWTLRKDGVDRSDPLWNINFYSELIKDLTCHYCQGPLNRIGSGLDAMNPGKKHVCYNVVPCCGSCNSKKMHDTTYDEMMLLAPVLREIRKQRELAGVQSGYNANKCIIT